MFCWDGLSCHERYSSRQYFMSSQPWASQMAQGGIFDTVNSAFGNANRIYIKVRACALFPASRCTLTGSLLCCLQYCSSDLWSGDVPASSATWNFAFRGARIVSAVMTALVQNHGMSGSGQRLLFGGCSAGAIGAMNNLDSVAQQLSGTGVEVRGLLDAAALVDIYPTGWDWSPDLIPLQTLIEELVTAIQPTFPSSCAERGYTGPSLWKCLFSAYRLPLVQTPFFANAVQFDDFEIQYETDNLGPSTPAQLQFVNSFQPAFLNLINSLPQGTGVYSPTCLVHCLSGQNTYFQFLVNGQTMSDAVNAWYFDNQPVAVISSCNGWECTSQCGVTYNGLPCNMGGAQQCTAVQLPTSESGEPQAATDNAVQLLPAAWYAQQMAQEQQQGQVQATEGSLSPQQQANLQSTIQQQQQQGNGNQNGQAQQQALQQLIQQQQQQQQQQGRKLLERTAAAATRITCSACRDVA